MKKCVIFILTLRDDHIHFDYANEIIAALVAPCITPEEYVAYVLECDENPESFQNSILQHPAGPCNLLVSIGLTITQMLPAIYEKTGVIPAVFLGIIAPVELGIVDSLEKTGRPYSGVGVVSLSAQHHAAQLKILRPHVSKLFIPHMPESFGGQVGEYAAQLGAALEEVGFEVVLKPVATPQEGLDVSTEAISVVDAVLLLDLCELSYTVQEFISYACAAAGRLLISGNGYNGIRFYGAPVSYGASKDFSMIPALVAMIQRFWRDGHPMDTQPVVLLSDVHVLHVNMFGLPWLPREILEAIEQDPSINRYRIWVDSPFMTQKTYEGSSVSVQ
jgi:hypothetical protein